MFQLIAKKYLLSKVSVPIMLGGEQVGGAMADQATHDQRLEEIKAEGRRVAESILAQRPEARKRQALKLQTAINNLYAAAVTEKIQLYRNEIASRLALIQRLRDEIEAHEQTIVGLEESLQSPPPP
jgi:hypothetical protein